MLVVPPNVVGLIFANRLLVDLERQDVSLIGIFQEKSFSSFPSAPLEMVVFLIVNGGRGEGNLELMVYQTRPTWRTRIG